MCRCVCVCMRCVKDGESAWEAGGKMRVCVSVRRLRVGEGESGSYIFCLPLLF